jgi:hypothetical protein
VIACDGVGLADFELLRYRRSDDPVTLEDIRARSVKDAIDNKRPPAADQQPR